MCVAKLSKNVGCLYIALMLKFYVNYEAQFLDYFGSLIKEVSIPAPTNLKAEKSLRMRLIKYIPCFHLQHPIIANGVHAGLNY